MKLPPWLQKLASFVFWFFIIAATLLLFEGKSGDKKHDW